MSIRIPRRIQRKRTKGYRMKSVSEALNGLDVVYVGRGTRYGNPFKITKVKIVNQNSYVFVVAHKSIEISKSYAFMSFLPQNTKAYPNQIQASIEATKCFSTWIERDFMQGKKTLDFLLPLRNKNLACFCDLQTPCHADIWIKLANAIFQDHTHIPKILSGKCAAPECKNLQGNNPYSLCSDCYDNAVT